VNGTQLQVPIAAADVSTPGFATVMVFNPAPGGGTSNNMSFAIQGGILPKDRVGTPSTTSLSPSSITAGMVQATVFNAAPVSSNPASGSGDMTFAFTFSDARGWQDLGVANILINNGLDSRHACFLAYSQPSNVLYMLADEGGTFRPGLVLSSSGSTSNSQCTVSWGSSPTDGNGNTLVLTLSIAFNTAFAGDKFIFMAAGDVAGNNSEWQKMGVWQVPGDAASTSTAKMGMTLSRDSGTGQTVFTFDLPDPGLQDLGVENILINNGPDGRQACYLAFARTINVLYLVNDAGDVLLPGQSLSSSGALSNSQCMVSWDSGAVVAANNGLALSLNISFSPGFDGSQIFYLAARDLNIGPNMGWQSMGTWTGQ